MWRYLRNSMLFIALLVGSVFGVMQGRGILAWHSPSWIVPALLFAMLFLAFCKINPRELRLVRWHVILLVIQIVGSMAIFFLVRPYSLLLAQALMLCVLMPTATAAPIITDRLGGNISEITAYVLLSNCMIALLVPALFPYVNPEVTISYTDRLLQILRHITPLLFVPFIGAWALRLIYDAIQRSKGSTKRFQLPAWLASLPFAYVKLDEAFVTVWLLLSAVLMAAAYLCAGGLSSASCSSSWASSSVPAGGTNPSLPDKV